MIVAGRLMEIESTAQAAGFAAVDAILLDLGVSSFQLDTAARGFSFGADGPLDMRFDPLHGPSAADIINTWDEEEIANAIFRYGEEHRSRAIARAIVRNRPIATTTSLAAIVEQAVGGRRGARIHPATRTFQALRIAVNQELEQIEAALPQMSSPSNSAGGWPSSASTAWRTVSSSSGWPTKGAPGTMSRSTRMAARPTRPACRSSHASP